MVSTSVLRYWYALVADAVAIGVDLKSGGRLATTASTAREKLCSAAPPCPSVTWRITVCEPTWSAAGVHDSSPVSGSTDIPAGPVSSWKVCVALAVGGGGGVGERLTHQRLRRRLRREPRRVVQPAQHHQVVRELNPAGVVE